VAGRGVTPADAVVMSAWAPVMVREADRGMQASKVAAWFGGREDVGWRHAWSTPAPI
jgi:hypothetical protein